jgi:hypothetical protein
LLPGAVRRLADAPHCHQGRRPWFLSLGPFYDVFEHYLGDDSVYGPRVRGWREIWQRRVDAGNDWPQLLMKRETTFEFVW